ncbi:MAG: PQQ-binding-like beta-propeller repeat protein [Pseudomonadota bacterium]
MLALAGCAGSSLPSLPKVSDLNPFKQPEKKLPGKRIPVMQPSTVGGVELASADRPVSLPPAIVNASWSQPGGTPSNAPGHVTFAGNARKAWSVDIGDGSGSRARLTAGPVVANGRIYTMDASSAVSAYSVSSGKRVWRRSVVPETERSGEAFGGGVAVEGDRVFAATGYGNVVALDANSGKKLWETSLGVPLKASPTVTDGQVFVIASDGRTYNLNATDGSQLWEFRGLPQRTGLVSNPSPAVANGFVVVPYPSGDVVAIRMSEGLAAWSESVASTRTSALGAISDASRPVISGGRVYVIGHSGRMIAADVTTGERIWSANVPGIQPPAVAGQNVFVVDVSGRLMSLDAKTGNALWSAKLPGATKWSGPTLASGRLWLASHRGQLVSVDASTGKVLSNTSIGAPVYLAPVIANGTLFVLTDRGRLVAYR